MNGDLIKAGIKALVAIATVVAGGTLGKKGMDDYNRYKQNKQDSNKC